MSKTVPISTRRIEIWRTEISCATVYTTPSSSPKSPRGQLFAFFAIPLPRFGRKIRDKAVEKTDMYHVFIEAGSKDQTRPKGIEDGGGDKESMGTGCGSTGDWVGDSDQGRSFTARKERLERAATLLKKVQGR